jgi:flagellar biosynthetic protein FlhB
MADGEEPDESQKTEDPTPKKLEEARKKGQVALSREVNNWVMLLAATIFMLAVSPIMMDNLFQFLALFIEKPHEFYAEPTSVGVVLEEGFFQVMKALALPFGIFLVAAIIGPLLQVGPLFAPEVLVPKLEKISIQKGMKRIFSMRALVEFAKGVAKLVIVALVATVAVYPFYYGIEHVIDLPIPYFLDEVISLLGRVLISIMVVLFVVALLDYLYQRNDHHKKMRMTKQEVKDEYKTTEGDPQVKARLRQLRMEKAGARMMQNVPQADVVITNPTHYAIALKYDPDESPAPLCVAKGMNETAQRIKEIAKEHKIVIQEDKPLARALYAAVEVDEMIPFEHFAAVAKIISYVFQRKGKSM